MEKINPGRFAKLRVVATQRIGAYLDWGQPEELFLPFKEQTELVSVGEQIVVFVFHDASGHPTASMRLDRYIECDTSALREQQKVDLLIISETKLGFQAIIEGRYLGVLYASEVFQELSYGSRVTGYVKKIREDGKVDLILQPVGMKGAADLGRLILDRLRAHGGFLPLTDRTTPEAIYEMFSVSKKKYKAALGGLYKKQLVSLEPEGIRLNG